jgi:hypothetical protein
MDVGGVLATGEPRRVARTLPFRSPRPPSRDSNGQTAIVPQQPRMGMTKPKKE